MTLPPFEQRVRLHVMEAILESGWAPSAARCGAWDGTGTETDWIRRGNAAEEAEALFSRSG